eukprot:TRINITY_DN7173_c0_g1_i1.p1 TRINITY_DN7173_c0_g1~~TRINITY_DN7173_c0_g1_i1.p1  ORF type:complete len:1147 (-),score=339.51 TRINITY_DN7173_c0_g1_i1:29-3400(-)
MSTTNADAAGVCALLVQLLSDDNATRRAAEAALAKAKASQPEQLAAELFAAIRAGTAATPEMRQLAATLLRSALVEDDPSKNPRWESFSPQFKQVLMENVLAAVDSERELKVSKMLSDLLADIATLVMGKCTDQSAWPQLLPVVFRWTKSPEAIHRYASFRIFAALAVLLPDDMFRPYFSPIKATLEAGLHASETPVRTAALEATASFLQVLAKPEETHQFQTLLPLMLECISWAINMQQQEEARKALELFIEIGMRYPQFFRPQLAQMVQAMLVTASTAALEQGTRQLALEVLVTLCESRPITMRKQTQFLSTVVPMLLSWMLEVEDDPDWETNFDDTNVATPEVAETALSRIATAVGGKTVGPLMFAHIPSLLSNDAHWQHRWAAVLAISVTAEGCNFVFRQNLAEILKMVVPLLGDPHPRVRWMAANCVGQFFLDFGPSIQETWGVQLMQHLLPLLADTSKRVQAHAAEAVSDFFETGEREVLQSYLEPVLTQLGKLICSDCVNVQEQAVTALSTLVNKACEDFAPFYPSVSACLKTIMHTATSEQYRELRGQVIECLSFIGVAVKKEIFSKDAIEVMETMVRTPLAADDPQVAYFESAFARLAECLGRDFAPFLDGVMPATLARAAVEPEVEVFHDAKPEEGWELVKVGNDALGVHTSQLEEKASSLHILLVYASCLGELYAKYLQQVASIMTDSMKCYLHEGVRIEASSAPPALVRCALAYERTAGEQAAAAAGLGALATFHYFLPHVVAAIQHEDDREVLNCQLVSLQECFEELDRPCLTPEMIQELETTMTKLIQLWQERRADREEAKKLVELDEEDEQKLNADENVENNVLSSIIDCLEQLARQHPETHGPYFAASMVPLAASMCAADKPWYERQKGLCLFDDAIEYSAPAVAASLLPSFMPACLSVTDGAGEPDGLRQAAVYGIGVAGLRCGQAFIPYINESLRVLHVVVERPHARASHSATHVTENAISSLLKICEGQAAHFNCGDELARWLSYLPITEEVVEGIYCYETLCRFVEQSDARVLGSTLERAPRVVAVVAAALLPKHFLNPQLPEAKAGGAKNVAKLVALRARCATVLRRLQAAAPAAALQQAWAELSAEAQAALQQLFASTPSS